MKPTNIRTPRSIDDCCFMPSYDPIVCWVAEGWIKTTLRRWFA